MTKLSIYWKPEKKGFIDIKKSEFIGMRIMKSNIVFNILSAKHFGLTAEVGMIIADSPDHPGEWYVAFLSKENPAYNTAMFILRPDWWTNKKNFDTPEKTNEEKKEGNLLTTIPKIEQFAEDKLLRGSYELVESTDIQFDDPAKKWEGVTPAPAQRAEYESDMTEAKIIKSLNEITFYKLQAHGKN